MFYSVSTLSSFHYNFVFLGKKWLLTAEQINMFVCLHHHLNMLASVVHDFVCFKFERN